MSRAGVAVDRVLPCPGLGSGQAMDVLVASVTESGEYHAVRVAADRVQFARTYRPTWATVVAWCLLPLVGIGIVFFFVKTTEMCVGVVEADHRGTTIRLSGRLDRQVVERLVTSFENPTAAAREAAGAAAVGAPVDSAFSVPGPGPGLVTAAPPAGAPMSPLHPSGPALPPLPGSAPLGPPAPPSPVVSAPAPSPVMSAPAPQSPSAPQPFAPAASAAHNGVPVVPSVGTDAGPVSVGPVHRPLPYDLPSSAAPSGGSSPAGSPVGDPVAGMAPPSGDPVGGPVVGLAPPQGVPAVFGPTPAPIATPAPTAGTPAVAPVAPASAAPTPGQAGASVHTPTAPWRDPSDGDSSSTLVGVRMRLPKDGPPRAILDDGTELDLRSVVLLGRDPSAGPDDTGAQLLPVADPERSVSKTHLSVELVDDVVIVVDRNSTNGCTLVLPDRQESQLQPGVATEIAPGSSVHFGARSLRVLSGEPLGVDGRPQGSRL